MYGELHQYLILHKQLNVPGIGTFLVERKPADVDVAGKLINPPAYTIALHHSNATPSKKMVSNRIEYFRVRCTGKIQRLRI